MKVQTLYSCLSRSVIVRIVAVVVSTASAATINAQPVDVNAQARASRAKLVARIAEVDNQLLRARLINATENRDLARWYAGEMQWNARWMSLMEAEQAAAAEEPWLDYRELRNRASDSQHDHERLARWCDKRDLADLARLHWMHVLRFDSSHRVALGELNLVWHDGVLLTTDEAEASKQRRKTWKKQSRQWQANVRRLKKQIEVGQPEAKQAARADLLEIRSPEAVPALIEELAVAHKDQAKTIARGQLLVDALGGIDSPAAIDSLTEIAIHSTEPGIRYASINRLKNKPKASYIPALISALQMPVSMDVDISQSGSSVVSSYTYAQEQADGSEAYRYQNDTKTIPGPRYTAVPMGYIADYVGPKKVPGRTVRVPINPGHGSAPVAHGRTRTRSDCSGGSHTWVLGTDYSRQYGDQYVRKETIPGYTIAGYHTVRFTGYRYLETSNFVGRMQAATEESRLATQNVERQLEAHNQAIAANNQRVAEVLTEVTGETLSAFPKSWWNWWGTYLDAHPDIGTSGTRQQLNAALLNQQPRGLARGTWVWTRRGKRPIEQVRPGDFVLSQDTKTGELAYQLVLAIAAPRSLAVSKVEVDETELHCAPGHVVWSTGAGWQRVSKLNTNQSLHGLAAESPINDVVDAFEIDSYDLIVDGFHTFFAGERGVLVHDGTPIAPTHVALPGFSPAAVATAIELAAN
ncbi:MAG: hypothetical protein AAGD11_02740 [Planctomycetota bacterium]